MKRGLLALEQGRGAVAGDSPGLADVIKGFIILLLKIH